MPDKKLNIAILGASGYTGAELIRLLLAHPRVNIVALTGDSQAGQPLADVFPQFTDFGLPDLVKADELNTDKIDVIFCCLPHGTTQEIIAKLPKHLKIVDLSADFRLHSLDSYNEWYGHPHRAPDLQRQTIYGLTEHHREAVKTARLVANPGCYPTASLLPLLPLMKQGLIASSNIIIDAKSGVSGAGRSAKRNLLFSELDEGMSPYSVGQHRHMPEIEQELSLAAGSLVTIEFTPHLIPMRRGMVATIYVQHPDATTEECSEALQAAYRLESFVRILPKGVTPSTHAVRGSNFCDINIFPGRRPHSSVIVSAIDNLVKGASGQAVQNMNVMFGFEETTALMGAPIFP